MKLEYFYRRRPKVSPKSADKINMQAKTVKKIPIKVKTPISMSRIEALIKAGYLPVLSSGF